MNIKLNKDFETTYPDDVWKGFTGRQTATIALAALVGCAAVFGIYKLTGLEVKYCVYFAMPVFAGILFLGFKELQGMFLEEYLKELRFERKIRHLSFDAGEHDDCNTRIFSMNAADAKERGKKRW